jgi:16S rRNA (cytidine1402-2'-O)-methyltransferase
MPEPAHTSDRRLIAPGLYLVSTPIGAARDITLRALDILAAADLLIAEDTRVLRHLMDIHGIARAGRRILSCNDHNAEAALPVLRAALAAGEAVSYTTDAGTPMVSDPGFALVRAAIADGYPVLAAPGPSALLCALAVSGLPTDRFHFYGFPPSQAKARSEMFMECSMIRGTLAFYESPRRLQAMLTELERYVGPDAAVVVCRELTKRFETIVRGDLATVAAQFATVGVKGEVVVLVHRGARDQPTTADVDDALDAALGSLSLRDAADAVARDLGLPRKQVYARALARKDRA